MAFEAKYLCRMKFKSSSAPAFTLIETVTAMAVVIVLTGLVISISGYVQKKGGQSRASGEIAMLIAAAESYKAENGQYPRDIEKTRADSKTDALSPKEHFIPTTELYEDASRYFYKELTGDKKGGVNNNPDGIPDEGEARYLREFDGRILKVNKDQNGKITEVKYLVDPFGYSYGYSTAAYAEEQAYLKKLREEGRASRSTGDSVPGFNVSSFDLWSTGGSKPSGEPSDNKKKDAEWAKWVKNW